MVSAALRYAASSSARRWSASARHTEVVRSSPRPYPRWRFGSGRSRPLSRGHSVHRRIARETAMRLPRRDFLRLAAAASAVPAAAVPATAQGYPTRPVRLILGFPAGGSTDLVARIMAAWLTDRLGQSVFVENKPGGGTNL